MSTALRPLDFRSRYFDDPEVVLRLGAAARIRSWFVVHRRSLLVLAVLLPLVALLHGWNMYSWPGIDFNDDEGTYVSQAWAVADWHSLAHYTYWYDHPPLGWIQLAAYASLTGAWSRAPYGVAVGREFMLVVDLAASALVYGLARRLHVRRVAAAGAVVLFAASPLALEQHRIVWLDNIGMVWLLAALFLAASPRRSLSSAAGSGVCFAGAVLTKETLLVLAPVVVYLLWRSSDVRTRRYRVSGWATLASALTLFYPIFAAVRNEFFEGVGHVSLVSAVRWQLFERASSGSVLTPGTNGYNAVATWLQADKWLLVGAVVLALPALAIPRLRPVATGLLLQVMLLLRPGYLPIPYVVALLPFAALVFAGTIDHLLCAGPLKARPRVAAAATVFSLAALIPLAGSWISSDFNRLTVPDRPRVSQAVEWMQRNVGPQVHVVVDDNVWLDLVRGGYRPDPANPSVVWVYKVGLDPDVHLASIDYFVYATDPINIAKQVPGILGPYQHSKVVARFGSGNDSVTVRKVLPGHVTVAGAPGVSSPPGRDGVER